MASLVTFDRRRFAGETATLVGVDEAGRGALAGPVSAAAVRIAAGSYRDRRFVRSFREADDSKKLTPERREELFARIELFATEGLLEWHQATGSVAEIAEHNILGATRLAMGRSVRPLLRPEDRVGRPETSGPLLPGMDPTPTVALLVDGRPLRPFPWAHEGIVGGDGRSLAIALASIVAKVLRDRAMCRLAAGFPAYGFERHKGYGSAEHRAALEEHGACAHHRRLFLRKITVGESAEEPGLFG